jgi:hypothetical protein
VKGYYIPFGREQKYLEVLTLGASKPPNLLMRVRRVKSGYGTEYAQKEKKRNQSNDRLRFRYQFHSLITDSLHQSVISHLTLRTLNLGSKKRRLEKLIVSEINPKLIEDIFL